jgi:hypothetical protein
VWGTAIALTIIYLRINPAAREAISHVHRCEPYVYAQRIRWAVGTLRCERYPWCFPTALLIEE